MNTETPVKSVKASKKNTFRPCISDKDTQPLNSVMRYNERTKRMEEYAGLTEEQKIAEGVNPPLQHQNTFITLEDGTTRQVGRFEKTKEEREVINKAKRLTKKSSSGWVGSDANKRTLGYTLIVHLKNTKRTKEGKFDKTFKTTYAFRDVAENEIRTVLSTIIRLHENEEYADRYSKYYYNGKVVLGNGSNS